jgi:hypothetical protein
MSAHAMAAVQELAAAPVLHSASEAWLQRFEQALHALALALPMRDPQQLDEATKALHAALATAGPAWAPTTRANGAAARPGALTTPPKMAVPATVQHRLAVGRAQVAAQREAVARATASADAALKLFFPERLVAAPLYGALGAPEPRSAGRPGVLA